MNDLSTVILAAGKGTRMRSSLPKVLHPVCGRPMLRLVLDVADALEPGVCVMVLATDTIDTVRQSLGPSYSYVVQDQLLGTGHALLQAAPLLRERAGRVLVLYGDTPLLRAETVGALCALQQESRALVTLISFHAHPPTGYGRVLRDERGNVLQLVEERSATPEQRAITECNSGIYCLDGQWAWDAIATIPLNQAKGEYYLTDLVELAVQQRGPGAALALVANDPSEALGVNDRAQLAQAEALLRGRLLDRLMQSGVTVADPASTYVDVEVEVGRDTTLLPGTLLQGRTSVGARCTIGPHTQLRDAKVGDDSKIAFAVVEDAIVPSETRVAPFTHLTGNAKGSL